ncbi:MAG: ATP-binding cassette domain-containing protein [Gemmatimonadaceae bacterium]|nr:ATP-binding cassette domain-containing protein [Gemmatimonadaceae bacterium]
MNPSPLLEADGVSLRRADRWILTSASLRGRPGIVTALLGRNGAGKTTLLRLLVGDLALESGTVRWEGAPLERPSRTRLARLGVCFLPAREVLHPRVAVAKQLGWIARDADRVPGVLDALRLTALGAQRPAALSGGERRRAELAAALVYAPRVLVLDEPLRGLAPLDAALILTTLRTFAADGGAVVLTGHELPLLEAQVDRVTWCYAGTTREFASFAEAAGDHAFRREFLGGR